MLYQTLIFLRKTYLDGKTDPALENDPDYIGIDNNGIIKYYKLISGGIDDVVIGRYHSVYSISDITMIF